MTVKINGMEKKTKLILIAVFFAAMFLSGFYFLSLSKQNGNNTTTIVLNKPSSSTSPKFPLTGDIGTSTEVTTTTTTTEIPSVATSTVVTTNTETHGAGRPGTPSFVEPGGRQISFSGLQPPGRELFRKNELATTTVRPRFNDNRTNIAFYGQCPAAACPNDGTPESPIYHYFSDNTGHGDFPFSNYWAPEPGISKIIAVEYYNDRQQFSCSNLTLEQCVANSHFISQQSFEIVPDNTVISTTTETIPPPSTNISSTTEIIPPPPITVSTSTEPTSTPPIIVPNPAGIYLNPTTEVCVQTLLNSDSNLTATSTADLGTTTVPSLPNTSPGPLAASASVVNCALLHVISLVVNDNGGTATSSDFSVHLQNAGVDVIGSPAPGTLTLGTLYSLFPGTYNLSETANSSYTQSFGGDCDSTGSVKLAAGNDKVCTIINTNIPPPPPASPLDIGQRIMPLIGILKVPTPLSLPDGPGPVTYDYTVTNVGGLAPLVDITVSDDKCSDVKFVSGDTNSDGKLDPGEEWKYSCVTTLADTTTDTGTVTGYSDDSYHQSTVASSIATVVVGQLVSPPVEATGTVPLLPETGFLSPLINIITVPDRLTAFPSGGGYVNYTYTLSNPGLIPINNLIVTDNKCTPVSGPLGDTNGDKMLDPGETWNYTCRTHISISTRNVPIVVGRANGFIAVGYAFSTVLVSKPSIPNLKFTLLGTIILLGILVSFSASWSIIYNKKVF